MFLGFGILLSELIGSLHRARRSAEQSEAALRRLNQDLAARVQDFETLLDVTPVPLMVTYDRDSSIINMNAAAAVALGINKQDNPRGPNPRYRLYRDGIEVPIADVPLRKAAREGISVSGASIELRLADGAIRHIVGNAAPLTDASGNVRGAVAAFSDVTDLLNARAAAEHTSRELARSNDDLRQFTYAASHDLQEPLRTVISYSQLLERRYAATMDEQAHRYLGFIIEAGRRLDHLLRDLREYWTAGDGSDSPVVVDSNAAVRKALTHLHMLIERADAETRIANLPPVRAHEIALVGAFQNLIANALKYRRDRPLVVEINARVEAGVCEFSVSDNGVGIRREYHDLIFRMFKRLEHRPESGIGIGLALCRKIVERYEGRIWVESEPRHGSTFRFTLPAAAPASAASGRS